MEQDREKIEAVVRKYTDRLGFVTDESTRAGAIAEQAQGIKRTRNREETKNIPNIE